jgi:2-methylcitrate dehydratase PrpD
MNKGQSERALVRRLGAFAHQLRFDDLPPAVVEKIKVCLVHNISCGLAGVSAVGPERKLVLREERARDGGARLVLDGSRLTIPAAAFANAALLHARAQDDVHFDAKTHLGAVCTGAALAVADASTPSGSDFLTALVGGYEVTAAVGKLFGNQLTARGFRATPVFAVFGAAAAAAKLLGLDRGAIADAIGIAASFAGGLNECWVAGTPEWRFQVGSAARSGVLAAMLAREGGHGAESALEGRAGFYRAFLDLDGAAVQPAIDALGATWETLAVVFKPHPVCSITQSPVSAALALLGRAPEITAGAIEHVRLWLRPDEMAYPGIDSSGPFHDVGATLMSAQFCVAMALVYRGAPLRALSDFSNSEILALVAKTEVVPDPALPPLSCRLEIRHAGGTESEEIREGPDAYNWNREQTLQGVARLAAEMPIRRDRLDRIVDELLHLDDGRSVGPLLDTLMPAADAGVR